MVVYSRPLMINNISWWISSASDRYIVTWLCGLAINGIYSVGYKIPSILNIFQTIFNQAWTISAVQDFDADDKNGFFTRMYNMYNFGMVAVCSVLIVLTKGIAHILYAKDFYVAWQYVPFLLLATLFGALSGYIGGIFAAVKDANIFAKSSIIGAIVNVILNIILILLFGSIGAAISTAISYVVTWALRMMHVKKYINLKCSMTRDITTYLLLVLQGAMLFIPIQTLLIYIVECGLLILILFLNKDQLQFILNKALKKGKSGNV
jgi:O-antigen/teichoic acid export membrane protein